MTMKMEALLEQIRAVQGADAWSVTERTEEGWEFYLIRGRLDQHRARQTRTFSVTLYAAQEDGKYLGHTLNIIPAQYSGYTDFNNYCPILVEGEDAEICMGMIQRDSNIRLAPYVSGVGAVQQFVPAGK